MDSGKLMEKVRDVIGEAADLMPGGYAEGLEIELKSKNDLVTEIDRRIEVFLVERFSKLLPESGFIAEEGTSDKRGEEYNWIIDPLDGTTNFVHGLPHFCISVALQKQNELILGVIYDFNTGDYYQAQKSGGSFRNGDRISVSRSSSLSKSLLATGFPYSDFSRINEYMNLIVDVMQLTRGLRRFGSAALDLAYVASGKFDAFFEYGLNPWDVAAGMLLVNEAGGMTSDFGRDSDPLFCRQIAASNALVHKELIDLIAKHFGR